MHKSKSTKSKFTSIPLASSRESLTMLHNHDKAPVLVCISSLYCILYALSAYWTRLHRCQYHRVSTILSLQPCFLFSAVCTQHGALKSLRSVYRRLRDSQFCLPTTSHHHNHATVHNNTYQSRFSSRLCDFQKVAVFPSPAPTQSERHH